jgi:putative transposase
MHSDFQQYAIGLGRRGVRTARIGSKWHLDEVFIKINGVQHYLWRAVDQNGLVIDILVQPKRDRWAALRFFPQTAACCRETAARYHHR